MLMAARRNSYVFSTLTEMGKVKGEGGGEEFEEEEIWAMVAKLNMKYSGRGERRREMASGNALRRQPTASRMVPRSRNETEEATAGWRPQSAPVNIPDWSQIQRKDQAWQIIQDEEEQGEEDELFEKGEMVPPHQLIARQLARSQMTSFSMCEGAGRTLKGRDLSRVRNAVLTRTGFLE
ncbi:protein S40-7 [Cryptomeria japonica]|uniref:protein S40-7 n=1 Tax=Cryptomeria japonica TaxID=3369 RepID=UPI0027DA0BF6|nr:protein S40-7 [Cryptomeria japonica]